MTFLDRPLAIPLRDPRARRSLLLELAVVFGVVFLVGLLVSRLNRSRSLRRLDAGVASGAKEGNYHAIVDVMSPTNWAYVVMGVSLLFNAMGAGHRFRLWRIDDARVKLENELTDLFGASVTLGDISRAPPRPDEKVRSGVQNLIARFEALAARSRRQSLSVLVPMGQEMAYRYQEEIIYETLAVLRGFLERSKSA